MIEQVEINITPEEMGIISRTIDNVTIHEINLKNFSGQVEEGYFLAHIYWPPTSKQCYPLVITQPSITNRSWVNKNYVTKELIRHQYGHYLIACCCSLEYQQIVNYEYGRKFKGNSIYQYKDWCDEIFRKTMNKYLQLQHKYDEQTQHYFNKQKQRNWESKIVQNINYFYRIFENRRQKLRRNQKEMEPILQKRYNSNQYNKISRQKRRRMFSNSYNLKSYSSGQNKNNEKDNAKSHPPNNNVVKIKKFNTDTTSPFVRMTTTVNYRIKNLAAVKIKLE